MSARAAKELLFPWPQRRLRWARPVQVGLRTGPTRLTLAGYYLNVTNDAVLSLTIGIGIGRREPRDPDD